MNFQNHFFCFLTFLLILIYLAFYLKVRFTSPHPKDFPDQVLDVIGAYPNIARGIHMPAQAGSNHMLDLMRRNHTREAYLELIKHFRTKIPGVEFSTDLISGFCGETEEEHADTLSLLSEVRYEMAYMFKYSERPRTLAERKFENDIPEDVKSRRLQEIMTLQRVHGTERTLAQKGKTYKVLIEGTSKKRDDQFFGRNTFNTVVVFPKEDAKAGTYVNVKTLSCTVATLIGEITEDKADA